MKRLLVSLVSISLLCGCQLWQQEMLNKAVGGLGEKLRFAIASLEPPAPKPLPDKLKPDPQTTIVKIFHADRQCQNLVVDTERIPSIVSQEIKVAATLENVLERQKIANFKVDQYKVTLDNGLATVDIKVNPTSERRIASLSSCEQFALFKAIEATLTKNQFLDVSEVRFTQAGQEIYL